MTMLMPNDEPPIDTSLSHYMEERALAIAQEKAATGEQATMVRQLVALREDMLAQRAIFNDEARVKRHGRGEIYSKARVAAINALGPSRAELEENVRQLYMGQPDALGVLKAHALTHFAQGLVSARLMLSACPPDIAEAARAMQAREEQFAAAWVAVLNDHAFAAELTGMQRDALRMLRTASTAMYLVIEPAVVSFDDADAQALGAAWRRLDALAGEVAVEPLSNFILVPDEKLPPEFAARRLQPVITALLDALATPGRKFPAKAATVRALAQVRDVLAPLAESGGRAGFEAAM